MNFFKKIAGYTAVVGALVSIGSLQAQPVNNLPGTTVGTSGLIPGPGVSAATFGATLSVLPVNGLAVSNDIAWADQTEGTTTAPVISNSTVVTSIVSGSATAGQRAVISGFTAADVNGTTSFLLNDTTATSALIPIPYFISSTTDAPGTGGTTTYVPGSLFIDQATALNDTAVRTISGFIDTGTAIVAGTYTGTLLVVNYLGV
jgi:hypothetical protein